MVPVGGNRDWCKKNGHTRYTKGFNIEVNNPKFRKFFRILDMEAILEGGLERFEGNAFSHAKREVMVWDELILDFKKDTLPLHGPLRSWVDDTPLCISVEDDEPWLAADAWKTTPYATVVVTDAMTARRNAYLRGVSQGWKDAAMRETQKRLVEAKKRKREEQSASR